MLQSLHDRIKGWIAGIIIGAISLSFILWGVQYYLQAERADGRVVAKVAGEKITARQLSQAYQQAQKQFTLRTGVLPTAKQAKLLQQSVLQGWILRKTLVFSARKAGFRVNRNQINQFILSIPQLQSDGNFSHQRYQRFLATNSVTPEQFARQINSQLLVLQVASGIQNSAFTLSSEIKTHYALFYQTRDFGYFIIPSEKFTHKVTVTNQMLMQYYHQYKHSFKIPQKVSIAYILLSPQQIAAAVTVSMAEVEKYYHEHVNNYRVPRRWQVQRIFLPIPRNATPQQVSTVQRKAQHLAQRLHAGTHFNTLMQEQNGLTQTVSQLTVSPRFAQALTALKTGQVSPPIRTAEGISIVRLLASRPAAIRPLAEVTVAINKLLRLQKIGAVLDRKSEQLANITYTNPTTLLPAAQALQLQIQTSPLFTRRGTAKGITANSKVVAVAFSDDVLRAGNNSSPIELRDGSMLVLRVKRHLASRIPPYRTVSAQIKQRVVQRLAQAQSAIMANKIVTALNRGASIANLSVQYHLTWISKKAVVRNASNIPLAIVGSAFALTTRTGHAATTVVLNNGSSAVIQVKSIKDAHFTQATQSQRQKLRDIIMNYDAQLDYRMYVHSARSHLKVNVLLAQ